MRNISSRERIILALDHKEPDRVPIDFGGSTVTLIHENAHMNLANYLKVNDYVNIIQSMITQAVFVDPRLKNRFRSDVFIITPGKPDKWDLIIDKNTGIWKDEWGNTYKRPKGIMYY